MNHSMRLAIFNWFNSLKLLAVVDTRFASIIVMLKRFKLIRRAREVMVMSDKWARYQDDGKGKARFVHELVVNEDLWEKKLIIFSLSRHLFMI